MPKLLLNAIVLAAILIFVPKASAANLKVNEFLAHPSPINKEWVEFYNPESVDLSTYWLDDDLDFISDAGSSSKKSLSTINMSSAIYPFLEFESFLNNSGDYVVLFTPDGTIVDQYQYTDDPGLDTSIGRSPDGTGDFVSLSSTTKGAANSQPQLGPTPTPSSTSTSQSSQSSTSTKSPSPTPKVTSTATAFKYPSPSPSKSTTILGEKSQIFSPLPTPNNELSTSPSPSSSPLPKKNETASKTKVASILFGSGAILIGVSVGFYLWYKRTLSQPQNNQEENLS